MVNYTFTPKINRLIYLNRGLKPKERACIGRLNKSQINFILNLRYAPDPLRYDKMLKRELVWELRLPRYQ